MPHAAALLLGCVLLVRGAIIPPRTDEPHYPGDEVLGTTSTRVPDLVRGQSCLRNHLIEIRLNFTCDFRNQGGQLRAIKTG